MNFGDAIKAGFINYVNFSGRSSRSEYWYWILFVVLVSIATSLFDSVAFGSGQFGPTYSLWGLATFLPGLSVSIRRLHDIDRTGWWWLLALTIIGTLVLIYWACQKGTDGPNRFGPDPLAWAAAPA